MQPDTTDVHTHECARCANGVGDLLVILRGGSTAYVAFVAIVESDSAQIGLLKMYSHTSAMKAGPCERWSSLGAPQVSCGSSWSARPEGASAEY